MHEEAPVKTHVMWILGICVKEGFGLGTYQWIIVP